MIYADVGKFDGECDPEAMIRNPDFVDWDGKVARHFVPCDYYEQFMTDGGELFQKAFGEFTHFAWFEYQDCEWTDFWIDHNNVLVGEWLAGQPPKMADRWPELLAEQLDEARRGPVS